MRRRPMFPAPVLKGGPRQYAKTVAAATDRILAVTTIGIRPRFPQPETPFPQFHIASEGGEPVYARPCRPPSQPVGRASACCTAHGRLAARLPTGPAQTIAHSNCPRGG